MFKKEIYIGTEQDSYVTFSAYLPFTKRHTDRKLFYQKTIQCVNLSGNVVQVSLRLRWSAMSHVSQLFVFFSECWQSSLLDFLFSPKFTNIRQILDFVDVFCEVLRAVVL